MAAVIAAGAWGGWKLLLSRDRKAFEACATSTGVNEIRFTHPPSRGALRHLARLPGGPWTFYLYWPAATAPAAAAGIGTVGATEIWAGASVDAGALLRDLARPGPTPKTLTHLYLWGTPVTDADLAALARPDSGLKALNDLSLARTNVTDVGLAALAHPDNGLNALTYLNLSATRVTDAGVKALHQARPSLKIRR